MNLPKLSMNGTAPHSEATSEVSDVLKEMLKGGLSLLWRGFEYRTIWRPRAGNSQ